ncbi:hypothetical protein ACFVWY_01105 [Streptomyces sp. NPDC058195]|uniref:hypothetical protein n=1 Tax=Streptomyces sp. NPDC058195 TaxID=3346375 RepID=UPI0036ED8D7F
MPAAGAQTPLAGREAGAGRPRPGRQLSPEELAHADSLFDQPSARPTASTPGTPPAASALPGTEPYPRQAMDPATAHQVKQVSLGGGIALIGLGLGFLAYRMRRVD